MVTDTISDFLTRIRNATLVKSQRVSVPYTKGNMEITKLFQLEGFIESYQVQEAEIVIKLKYKGREQRSCITNVKRLSKPGRRLYSNAKDLPRILGGMGVLIISTSSGVMTDRQARQLKVGGELICSIW
jgi:small subunit ribosomal protein S8